MYISPSRTLHRVTAGIVIPQEMKLDRKTVVNTSTMNVVAVLIELFAAGEGKCISWDASRSD